MKLKTIAIFATCLTVNVSLFAVKAEKLRYRPMGTTEWTDGFVDFASGRISTKETPDATSVTGYLIKNEAKLRWEVEWKVDLTSSYYLTEETDITPDTEVELSGYIFPVGHPEELNSIKVFGETEQLEINETLETYRWRGCPVMQTPSASTTGVLGYRLGLYFSYAGNSPDHPGGEIDYGNSVFQTNVDLNDIGMLMHPSSNYLWGSGFSVNGTPETEGEFKVYAQQQYISPAFGGMSIENAGVYIDGYRPEEDIVSDIIQAAQEEFSLTAKPETNAGDQDVWEVQISYKYGYSERDIQIGYFNTLWWGATANADSSKELDWFGRFWVEPDLYGPWIYHETLQWLYTPEGAPADQVFLYSIPLGWTYTTPATYPLLYVFDYEGDSFWSYPVPGTFSPREFWAEIDGEWVKIEVP